MSGVFAAIQAGWEDVYRGFGSAAPPPMNGESETRYRQRLAAGMQKYSPRLKDASLSTIANPALGLVEDMIREDARREATAPTSASISPGQMAERKSRDATGRETTTFHSAQDSPRGTPKTYIGQMSRPRKFVTRFNLQANQRHSGS